MSDTDLRSQIEVILVGELLDKYVELAHEVQHRNDDLHLLPGDVKLARQKLIKAAAHSLTNLIQERDTKLKEALLGALPEHDDIGNHDRETSSITPAQVEAFNQAIDQTRTAINKVIEEWRQA